MKRLSLYIAMLALSTTVYTSCSSDSEEVDNPTKADTKSVEIITTILTKSKPQTEFKSQDNMSVFAKTYNKLNAPTIGEDVVATFDGANWKTAPSIDLKTGEHTFIYAVSPVVTGVSDLAIVPVDITKQQDVLYSGSAVPVSYTSNVAKVTMKHALALTSFNIATQGYHGKGMLEQLAAEGNNIFTQGTMTVDKGKLTGTSNGQVTIQLSKNIVPEGWKSDLPNIWVIPFSTLGEPAYLKARIDGKEYVSRIPEIEIKGGYQYVFHLVLTDYGLEFIPSQTETLSLNQDTDEMGALEGYGILRFKHHSTEFATPALIGESVFGTIIWGNGQSESYANGASMKYDVDGNYEVAIESWNTTGFELGDIIGVDEIDLSQY